MESLSAESPTASTNRAMVATPIVCVENLGPSDKPAFPLVIAATRPPRAELSNLLSPYNDPDFIRFVPLPAAEARRLAVMVEKLLRRSPATLPPSVSPVLRVVVAGLGAEEAPASTRMSPPVERRLSQTASLRFLEALEQFRVSEASANNGLHEATRDFRIKSRLQPHL